MKKHILRALCVACVLTLCLPMAACDMELGGLVGELLANKEPEGVAPPEEWASDAVIEDILPDIETAISTGWDEDFSGDIAATEPPFEDTTYEYDYDTESPTTEIYTTEPPVEVTPIPDPVIYYSPDEYDTWIGEQLMQQFVFSGGHASWDGHAMIEDYHVEYLRIFGWVAFDTEQIGKVGYRFDNDEYIFDNAFLVEAEQPVIDAALYMGALSVSRIEIYIPVKDLSGQHVIEIVGCNAYGDMEILDTFTVEKTADPGAPFFFADAYDMASCVEPDAYLSMDVLSAKVSEDGSYVTLVSGVQYGGDPWIFLGQGKLLSTGARYLVVKYRTSAENAPQGEFFVGSSFITGGVDQARFEYINDGNWHLQIIDLTTVQAVNDYLDIKYLRYDFYVEGVHEQPIDVAYVAIFTSEEAAIQYDSEHPTSMN